MARKIFPTSRRAAIWRAHEQRCIYCTELVAFADLDIDHIIPARLKDRPEELSSILKDYGLQPDLDVDSMLNLVPSHRHCNLQKKGLVLPKNRALHFLSIAESRYDKACEIEAEIKTQEIRDRLTVLLEVALEEGRISREEISELIAGYAAPQDAFEILTALPFGDSDLKGFFRSTDVDLLYERPILPRPHGLDGLTMVKGGVDKIISMFAQAANEKIEVYTREWAEAFRDGLLAEKSTDEEIVVYTCREWAEAVRDGYYALTTLTIKEESLFKKTYALIAALAQAKPPKHKFISGSSVSIANFDLLPVAILPSLSGDGVEELQRLELEGVTISDLIAQERVRIISSSPLALTLHYDGMGLHLNEILRADLNDDGIEDLLIGAYEWALGGTFGAGYAKILTRLGTDQSFTVANNVNLEP
jgi:hypothetical protein